MSSSIQKLFLIVLILLSGLIVIKLIIFPSPEPIVENTAVDIQDTKVSKAIELSNESTIANAWQWQLNTAHVSEDQKTEIASLLPFTQESVYKALHAVKLDDNGNIILDDDALNALNAALDDEDASLDNDDLETLKALIEEGLPGSAGEQLAQIVADYYQYLGARNEFNSLYASDQSEGQNIEHYEAQYKELSALREVYLGSEVASKLFSTFNANSQYMFDSMKLDANTKLSKEEKKHKQAQIIERHAEATTSVNNWNERYQAFLADKQYIVNSSIANNEKRVQIKALLHERFSDEELEYVSHLQLDSL